jgi:chromosome segregation ATPase
MGMSELRKLFWAIVLIGNLAGCATSHTSPEKVSMWDLWFDDRLKGHLAERKLVLDDLRARVDLLAVSISHKTNELAVLQRDIDIASTQGIVADKELQSATQEIQARSVELTETQQRIAKLHAKIAQSEKSLHVAKNGVKGNTEAQKYKEEIERLENEAALLGRSIDRILLVRAKHGLQTK